MESMFSGFNLKLTEQDIIAPGFYAAGKELFERQKSIIKKDWNDYILEDGALSESEIEKDWFPSIETEVFLSNVIKLSDWNLTMLKVKHWNQVVLL